MNNVYNWYVITTRSRAEKKVSMGLSKIGVEHFLPLQKQLKQWKDRKQWVELPLFSSYIFVHTTEQQRNDVFHVQGVVKFLSIKGKLSVLTDEELERVRKICTQENEVQVSGDHLAKGEEVEVVEGSLKGLRGRIIEQMNNTYLYIQIENLGFVASFKIDKRIVKRVL
ncbi:MAG: UpxY family transcription antiterminator [Phycisphaerales bacterium]|nr:UpxY family transcription antiterminator [Phycisphaerales bacterium]